MTIHLIKLCVGCDSIADLEEWQNERLKQMRKAGKKPELIHPTRQTPKRGEELLAGGSLYWVINGFVSARQQLLELKPVTKNGIPHCGLVLNHQLIRVNPRPQRAFQGWRYLEAKSAPKDIIKGEGIGEMPEKMRRELAALGLL
jgi:hypothetical protein